MELQKLEAFIRNEQVSLLKILMIIIINIIDN